MKREEAIKVLERIMNNNFYGGEVQTVCKMGIDALSQPSLPSDLDEAAENRVTVNGRFEITPFEKMRIDDIKFGAELMAEQGETFNGYISIKGKRSLIAIEGKPNYKFGEKVVVQIRKKVQ